MRPMPIQPMRCALPVMAVSPFDIAGGPRTPVCRFRAPCRPRPPATPPALIGAGIEARAGGAFQRETGRGARAPSSRGGALDAGRLTQLPSDGFLLIELGTPAGDLLRR